MTPSVGELFPPFSTARLNIRSLELADACFVLKLVNDPDWLANIGDRDVHNLAQAEEFISRLLKGYETSLGLGLRVFCDRSSGVAQGICGLLQREFLDFPDIGYAILPEFRGQGLTLEACKAIHDRYVLNYPDQALYAMISPDNSASIKLVQKLGFTSLGVQLLDSKSSHLFKARCKVPT